MEKKPEEETREGSKFKKKKKRKKGIKEQWSIGANGKMFVSLSR